MLSAKMLIPEKKCLSKKKRIILTRTNVAWANVSKGSHYINNGKIWEKFPIRLDPHPSDISDFLEFQKFLKKADPPSPQSERFQTFWKLRTGVATIVQGMIVQGDSCPRDFCPRDSILNRLLSKEALTWSESCLSFF